MYLTYQDILASNEHELTPWLLKRWTKQICASRIAAYAPGYKQDNDNRLRGNEAAQRGAYIDACRARSNELEAEIDAADILAEIDLDEGWPAFEDFADVEALTYEELETRVRLCLKMIGILQTQLISANLVEAFPENALTIEERNILTGIQAE